MRNALGNIPIRFEANQGQTAGNVKYLARGSGYNLFLTRTEAVLSLHKSNAPRDKKGTSSESSSIRKKNRQADSSNVLSMKLVGANSNPRITGMDELPGKSNYFLGSDPKKWRANVPNYARVKYSAVYPGVDLIYSGKEQQLEYDFVVSPGANPKVIHLRFGGASKAEISAQGDLVLRTKLGEIQHRKPLIYQELNGTRVEVNGGYILKANNQVGFYIGNHDASKPVIIDPAIVYSTYLGGRTATGGVTDIAESRAQGIATYTDPSTGKVYAYVVGTTYANDFPLKNAMQTIWASQDNPFDPNQTEVFVTKLDLSASGANSIVFSTFLGGSRNDKGYAVAVDTAGNAYITGVTWSINFPVANAFQATSSGRSKAFVSEINANGSALVYSTYLGGNEPLRNFSEGSGGHEEGRGIAVDTNGNAFIAGWTDSATFLTVNAYQLTNQEFRTFPNCSPCLVSTAFVVKVAPPSGGNPAKLVYSTYLGGSGGGGGDAAFGVAADASGNAYVVGMTDSYDFPVTPNAYQMTNTRTPNGGPRGGSSWGPTGFISKINTLTAGQASLLYSTYFGGSTGGGGDGESCSAVAVDPLGYAYVTGTAKSRDFPTTPNSFKPNFDDDADAFVAKLDMTKSGSASLVYSTRLGGHGGSDSGSAIAVDSAGNAFVTGTASSADFPLVNPAQTYSGGLYETTDGGVSLVRLNKGLTNNLISALVLDTSKVPRTIYLAALPDRYPGGIFKSTDGGNNWSAINAGLSTTNVTCLALDSTNPETIFAGTADGGIFKSTSAGANWVAVNNGLSYGPSTSVNSLTFDTVGTTRMIYAGTGDNLYRSTDGGSTWIPTGLNSSAGTLVINSSTTPHTLFTGIQRSTDGGNTWTTMTNFCTVFVVGQVLGVDTSTIPFTIYANDPDAWDTCGTGTFIKSTDNGNTWQDVYTTQGFQVDQLAVDTTTLFSTLYASFGGVIRSSDGGSNWSSIARIGDGPIAVDTNSETLTTPPTIYFTETGFDRDVFVTEINSTGSALLFSTFLGGNESGAAGIALDSQNNIYITGSTSSHYYPTLNALQPTWPCLDCQVNGFVTKLGSAALPSTSNSSVTTQVAAQSGTLELSFPNITGSTTGSSPTVTVNPLDSSATANLTLSNNLGGYDIKTTATYDTSGYASDPTKGIKISFSVPTVNDPTVFSNLVITHGEDSNGDGVIQPAEMIPYNGLVDPNQITYHDFVSRTVWIYAPSLSPFVIVKGVGDQLNDLIRLVKGFNLKAGVENSLDAKLQNALKAYQAALAKDRATACNQIGAFINEVQGQTGKMLSQSQASQLIAAANQIKVVLGCR